MKDRKTSLGFSLIELLVAIVIIALLISFLLSVISKIFSKSKSHIWGIYSYQNQRIEAYLGEDEKLQQKFSTNHYVPWNFNVSPLSSSNQPNTY